MAEECLKVCETCPWLKKNQGKKHKAGWYKLSNLKRLWNGLRTGKAPGMICHSTDPSSKEYGGSDKIKPDSKPTPCAGAILALGKHVNEMNASGDYNTYAARKTRPITKRGVMSLYEQQIFGGIPAVEDRSDEIGFPWPDDKENT